MARLLVLDIDGTILDPSDIITPIVRQAISDALEHGVEGVLATGRRLRTTLPIVQELGIRLPLVLYNGSLIWSTMERKPLHREAFSPEVLAPIIERSMAAGLPPVLLQGPSETTVDRVVVATGTFENGPNGSDLPSWYEDDELERLPMESLHLAPDVLKVNIFGTEEEVRAVSRELSDLGIAAFHAGPFYWRGRGPQWTGIYHMPGASKASAVARLAADLGITMDDVVAVGDGDNDLELLEAAGIGVAMGNAPAFVQERANVVVRGHDEDGVAEAIERVVLAGRRG
jgi:hydroxymethylpyrimidine pyrophosphatase-like HAD family hydrolase